MLQDLLRRLAGRPENDSLLPPEDQRIAIAALLVTAAHADHNYEEVERNQIERVLADRYSLAPEAAARLRAEGEAAETASVDLYRFTSVIKAGIPYEERASVIEGASSVASHRRADPLYLHRPQPNGLVPAAGRQGRAIGAEGDG